MGLTIRTDDLRRACEMQVKSHLLHLRENYVECRGRQSEVAALVAEAAPAFALILRRLARLDGAAAETNADLGAYAARRPGLDRAGRWRRAGDGRRSQAAGVDADPRCIPRIWQRSNSSGASSTAGDERDRAPPAHAAGDHRRTDRDVGLERSTDRRRRSRAQGFRSLTAPVNDFAGVIDRASKDQLDALMPQAAESRPAM